MSVKWRIERQHRVWTADEFRERYDFFPERLEVVDGKMLIGLNDRINLLGFLLENLGTDAAVRLGSVEVWEQAVAAARGRPRETDSRTPSWQLEDDSELVPTQADILP